MMMQFWQPDSMSIKTYLFCGALALALVADPHLEPPLTTSTRIPFMVALTCSELATEIEQELIQHVNRALINSSALHQHITIFEPILTQRDQPQPPFARTFITFARMPVERSFCSHRTRNNHWQEASHSSPLRWMPAYTKQYYYYYSNMN